MVTNRISLHHLNLTPLIHPELENLQRPSAHQLTSLTKFDETKKSTPPQVWPEQFWLGELYIIVYSRWNQGYLLQNDGWFRWWTFLFKMVSFSNRELRSFLVKCGNLMEYCWWTKSCTTKDDDYPMIYRVLTIPGGAGFLPSTVWVDIVAWWF